MALSKRIRYGIFVFGLTLGTVSLAVGLTDYVFFFLPAWRPADVDRLLGFGPWISYLATTFGLTFHGFVVAGVWLAGLMFLLPGRLKATDRI